MKKRATTKALIVMLILLSLLATSALAYNPDYTKTYGVQNGTASWQQATSPTFYIYSGNKIGGGDQDYFEFYAVATSSSPGSFKVRLQRKVGIFWVDAAGGASDYYTFTMDSGRSYNPITGQYVQGHFNAANWYSNEAAQEYRVVLYDVQNPQSIGLTNIYFYSASNHT